MDRRRWEWMKRFFAAIEALLMNFGKESRCNDLVVMLAIT
jgi:hypothetical protein